MPAPTDQARTFWRTDPGVQAYLRRLGDMSANRPYTALTPSEQTDYRNLTLQMFQYAETRGYPLPDGYRVDPPSGELVDASAPPTVMPGDFPGPSNSAALPGTGGSPAGPAIPNGPTGSPGGPTGVPQGGLAATDVAGGNTPGQVPSAVQRYGGLAADLVPLITGMLQQRQAGQRTDQLAAQSDLQLALQAQLMQQRQSEEEQSRFKTAQDLPGQRLSTGLRAASTANYQPVAYNRDTGLTGGANNPNYFGPQGAELANDVFQQELEAQKNREMPPPIPPLPPIDLNAMRASGQPSRVDSALGYANTGLSLWAAWQRFRNQGRRPMPTPTGGGFSGGGEGEWG